MSRPQTFSPRERKARQYVRTQAWKRKNRGKMRLLGMAYYYRDEQKCIAATRRYEREHPGWKRKLDRAAVVRLADHYVRNNLRAKWGIENPTPEQIESQRQRILRVRAKNAALRARPILAIVASCASLTKKSPTS